MTRDRLFLDTVFVKARFSRSDQHHARAELFAPRVRKAAELWTTEAVLIEVANGLAAIDRAAAAQFIRGCYSDQSPIRLVRLSSELLLRALDLYASHRDKSWGLTDCVSFVVMREVGLTDAVTTDRHFVQAGFRALLIDGVPRR
jgi:hypothetical protein